MPDNKTPEPGAPPVDGSQTNSTQTVTPPAPPAAAPGANPDASNNGDGHSDNGNDDGLKKLEKDELVNIIKDTRAEAKNRRLKQRELETQINTIGETQKLNDQKQLEANQEWEKAYNKVKEETADYGDLKRFKESYEKECQVEVDKITPTLTKPELEIFDLSKEKMSVTEQILFIKKLIDNRPTQTVVDNTQSVSRGGQPEKSKVTIPFGNTSSVIGRILETLKSQREKK